MERLIEGKTRHKYFFICSYIIYKILYEFIYATVISPLWTYFGLVNTPNNFKCMVSYLAFFVLLKALPKDFTRVSSYLVNIFFIFTIIPILSFYWQANASSIYTFYCCVSFMLVCLICRFKFSLVKIQITKYVRIEHIIFFIVAAFMVLLTVSYGIADLRAVNIMRVYEIRAERVYPSIWGYLINWVPSAFIPCLMCIAIYYKNKYLLLVAVFMQAYLFLFTGNKTVLFSLVLILVSYFIMNTKKNFVTTWLWLLSGGAFSACGVYWLSGSISLLSIVPVRLFNIPAMLSYLHYNFFSVNPKLLLSESAIGKLLGIESPYSQFSTYMLSPNGNSNANTGYLGDAYDNGGFLLMILFSILLALILVFVDMIATKKTLPVFVSVLTYTMIILNDAPLLTTLLTGGLFLNIAVLYLFKRQENAIAPPE